MIPPEYFSFFSTMAAVGATLFGLIFVAISIVPESVTTTNASPERQVRAATAYIALLNPLVIALFALIPHQQIGIVVIGMSTLGLVNTLGMTLTLIRSAGPSGTRLRHSLFILGGFFLYGYESYFAIRLTPKKVLGLFVRTFSTDFLIVASKEVAIAGLEEKLLPAQKQTSFLRTTLDTRAGLQTAYWLMDGHGLGKIVQLQPINQDGQKTFEIQDVAVEPAGSHPLWPDSLPEVRLAAQWLADLQAKNQSGFWPTEQLQAELNDIVEKVTMYTEDSDLLAQLDAYKGQYLEGLTNLTMPVVVEHGDFTPSNIIVTKDQTIQVIHWENSKQVGHPMMDIGGLYLSLLLKDPHSEDSLAAIHESYHLPFEIPLRLSPAYFVLRSINREMRDSSLNAKNYVSWKYWVQPLRLALQHTNLVKVH